MRAQASLRRLRKAQNLEDANRIVKDILKDAREANDLIYFSDLMISEDVAMPLMQRLRNDKKKQYHLRVLKDKWGAPVNPGDIVKREFKEPLYKVPGVPISSKEISASVKAGKWEEDFLSFEEFEVDEKGCILCSADDMWYFLSHFGIHSYSGQRLSFHINETSAGPQKMQYKKGMKHAWYWLYKEMDKEQYAELENIKVI